MDSTRLEKSCLVGKKAAGIRARIAARVKIRGPRWGIFGTRTLTPQQLGGKEMVVDVSFSRVRGDALSVARANLVTCQGFGAWMLLLYLQFSEILCTPLDAHKVNFWFPCSLGK